MLSFNDLSIRRKVALLVMFASLMGLFISTAAIIFYDHVTFQSRALEEVNLHAGLLEATMHAPLNFDDRKAARENLDILKAQTSIVAACVYNGEKEVFASYPENEAGFECPSPTDEARQTFDAHFLHMWKPISLDGEVAGYFYLRYALPDLTSRLLRYSLLIFLIALVLLAVALALASSLEGVISAPILELVRAARQITQKGEYKTRAQIFGRDELGQLTLVFNHMMDTIEQKAGFVELLQVVAVASNQAAAFEDALEICLAEICNHGQWRAGHALVFGDDESRRGAIAVQKWFHQNLETTGALSPVWERLVSGGHYPEIVSRVIESGKPAWSLEPFADFGKDITAGSLAMRSATALPVLVGSQVAAVLTFFSESEQEPDKALMEVLAQVGTQLGRVVERRRAEARIRERDEQLRHSQKMEAMGRLAGGIAHDFNNLLTAINGYSALLLKKIEGSNPIRTSVVEISKAGERAAALTGQLLAFSRKQVLSAESIDLNQVVRDMDKMFERVIGEDVQLEMTLESGLRPFKANRGQIEQILMNLVVNARDAMPTGGQITISTRSESIVQTTAIGTDLARPGTYSVLMVADTGQGMDLETQRRIFEPFYTTKPLGEGTGLGLSTVFGIVKRVEGFIDVHSERGKGSLFEIYFPVREDLASDPELINGALHAPVKANETILLVEDEDAVRKLTCEILTDTGYAVLEASSGKEALEICRKHQGAIDLLLTDVVMSHMSGRELAEKLVAMRPMTRVVYMSGYTDDAVLRRGVETSGLAFINKPFSPDTLTTKIREVLKRV